MQKSAGNSSFQYDKPSGLTAYKRGVIDMTMVAGRSIFGAATLGARSMTDACGKSDISHNCAEGSLLTAAKTPTIALGKIYSALASGSWP